MNEYIGKVCPFCKTEIKEGDAIKVCSACAAPHHEGCWEENKGCTTFGCSEQHYEPKGTNPTDVCANCGATLGDGQDFCPKCGTHKGEVKNNLCGKCGAELQDGQEFCPKCGQKAGLAVDNSISSAINQFNSGVTKSNKKKVIIPIVIAIVVVIAIILGVVISNIMKTKNIENATAEYIGNAEEFSALSLTAGANLEDIADTVQSYWYDYIYDDEYYSMEGAIYAALIDKSDEISQAETDYSKMQSLYNKLKKVPDGVEDDELEDICDAVKELYNIYTDYYSFATDPSGSYKTYSEDNGDKTDEFLSSYRALDNLLG